MFLKYRNKVTIKQTYFRNTALLFKFGEMINFYTHDR